MSRQTVSLKCRVRFEGRSHTMDRRAGVEQLPDPVWHTVGQVLRQNFHRIARGERGGNTTPAGK